MRYVLPLLLLAACSKSAPDTGAAPAYEWLCNGRLSDRQVTTRVMASSRDEAIALAKKEYPDMVTPSCSPNPRR